MQARSISLIYRVLFSLFILAMFMDAMGGLMKAEAGQEVMRHLGYPIYLLTIFGIAKLAGVLALLQTWSSVLKEWAYAGFTINFVGAFASRVFVGDEVELLLLPLIMLAYLFTVYFLWKKVVQSKEVSTGRRNSPVPLSSKELLIVH